MAGDIAAPGERFNPTDVLTTDLPQSRMIFVWSRGSRWIVAMERGGIAYTTPVYAYDLNGYGFEARLVKTEAYPARDTICATAYRLLDAP